MFLFAIVHVMALSFVKNWVISRGVKWLASKGEAGRERRFLVVTTTGLGDTLWATPALKALKASFPDAYIAVLTSPVGKELLANNRQIHELFVWEKSLFALMRLLFSLRKRKIGSVLMLHTSQRAVLPFCSFLGAKELIGTQGMQKGLDALLTCAIEKKRIHEIERRLEIVAQVGARTLDPTLELACSEHDEKKIDRFLQESNIPAYLPLVGLHPGAKDVFKRWPKQNFVALGNRLVDHIGCQIIVTGNREEMTLVHEIAREIKGALAVCGKLSLGEMTALIKRFSLMVTNDTGPMHMAFALKTPTVALFTPTDPRLCGPYFAKRATVIAKKPTCTPCIKKRCRDPFCLLQISEDEVYAAAIERFYEGKKDA